MLGWPTASDFERYDRPEGGSPVARLLAGFPRIGWPRGARTRRLTAALVALGLLALGAQLLDDAVFGPRTGISAAFRVEADGGPGPVPPSAWAVADAPPAEPAGPVEPVGLPSRDPVCALGQPGSTTPVVRPISRRVTTAVNRQWRRIERWLRAHAPRTYASLNGPAAPRLVAKAEARLGMPIPDSLRASLLRHDGARGPAAFRLPPSHRILGARGLVASRPEACAMGGGLPVARGSGGDYLVTGHTTGGVGFTGRSEDEWSSYYALLKTTADALAGDHPMDGPVPVVREGVLGWK
ncbi:hypothetical protein [Microbispora sp. H11081]|uniref:hypothetical protein n=1 Tax=Microbispora sp. H11081 TaxID=2729107 RepID=UPI001475D829|nr:hypothetical protein [Microbispora sp. H11081]